MKEITEDGQVYLVSDNYPKIPYEKYLKARDNAVKTVTGKDVFNFLSPSWETIYDNIPDVHAWRWDHFKQLMQGNWNVQVPVTNPTLVETLNGLATLSLIDQSDVNDFLGN
jgi:hypothetical protein